MKRIKYLFLLLVVFLFSGCAVTYDLNIDKDLSVTEKVKASEKESALWTNTGMKTDKAINYLYDIFKRDGIEPSISTTTEGENVITIISASHKSLNDYAENFTSDLFKEVNMTEKNSIVTLKYKQSEKLSNSQSNHLVYDKVTINIYIPFKVIDSNADSSYRNTYTWNINSDEELRNIFVTFDTSKNDNTASFSLGFFKINVKYSVLALLGMILIIVGIVVVVYIKNKKNNKF